VLAAARGQLERRQRGARVAARAGGQEVDRVVVDRRRVGDAALVVVVVAISKAFGLALPMSSLARITMRRAMKSGSSPPSTMRASQ